MKNNEKLAARKLRKDGFSILSIAKKVGVAKSSVSCWVRDIKLTEEQVLKLNLRNPNSSFGSKVVKEKYEKLRKQYQEEGREKARKGDVLFIAGCMLYWGEGSKNKNTLCLANSDVDLLRFYVKFLRESLLVKAEDIALSINCYTDIHSIEEIEDFWINGLQIPRSCLRKSTINSLSSYSLNKRCGKLEYGTCRVSVHSTKLVQSIYGGIQEIVGFNRKEWLG